MRLDMPRAALAAISILLAAPAAAQTWPPEFAAATAEVNGVRLHRWAGGQGDAVVLIHGYAETADMWIPLAAALAKNGYKVIAPDIRGLGRSSRPADGYDKKTAAQDIRALVKSMGHDRAHVVGHDIGLMIAYAYAAQFPAEVSTLTLMDAPLPGVGPWEQVKAAPALWHFNFYGRHAERLVEGRERIYLDRFWDEFSADPSTFGEAARRAYAAAYAEPGAMRAGFSYFAAFARDAEDNAAFARTKLTLPVLAIGGERSAGALVEAFAKAVATNVAGRIIPGAGHWLIEERPEATIAVVQEFLKR